MDNNGYVLSGLSLLLIIPSIILLMVFIDMMNSYESPNTSLKSDITFHIVDNIENNIPYITRQILKDTAGEVVNTGEPVQNSRELIKSVIQSKIDNLNRNYGEKTGATIKCTVISVDSAKDPFEVEVKTNTFVMKDNVAYNRNITQNVSLLDQSPINSISPEDMNNADDGINQIPDPLPFIKCKKYGGATVTDERVTYGSSLSNYLNSRGIQGSNVYENASSPFYIKRCPYNSYLSHENIKNFETIKNCIDNGYYHRSSDGACFLCRLEGKATCNHSGIETFIIPSVTINKTILSAPCSLDHVIFNDTVPDGSGTYPGEAVEYQYSSNNSSIFFSIFLDFGHRTKYGLQPYNGV